jgi:hypothetical protein
MCHQVVSLELLPSAFLEYLLESDETQVQHLHLISKEFTPVKAVLTCIDPKGDAPRRHATEFFNKGTETVGTD